MNFGRCTREWQMYLRHLDECKLYCSRITTNKAVKCDVPSTQQKNSSRVWTGAVATLQSSSRQWSRLRPFSSKHPSGSRCCGGTYLAGACVCVCVHGWYLSSRQLFIKGVCRSLLGSNYSFGLETAKGKTTKAKSALALCLKNCKEGKWALLC